MPNYFGVAGKYTLDASGNRVPAEAWPDAVLAVSKVNTLGTSISPNGVVLPAMPCCGNNTNLPNVNAFGPELVTNGDFASSLTGWTANDWTWNSGSAQADYTDTMLSQAITLTVGANYLVTFTSSQGASGSSGQIRIGFTGTGAAVNGTWRQVPAGQTTFTETLTAVTGNNTLVLTPATFFAGVIDNVSVKRIL